MPLTKRDRKDIAALVGADTHPRLTGSQIQLVRELLAVNVRTGDVLESLTDQDAGAVENHGGYLHLPTRGLYVQALAVDETVAAGFPPAGSLAEAELRRVMMVGAPTLTEITALRRATRHDGVRLEVVPMAEVFSLIDYAHHLDTHPDPDLPAPGDSFFPAPGPDLEN